MDSEKERKLEKLKAALENYTGGQGFFDELLEENKAKVRNRALLLLDQRGRSREELRTRLIRLDFEPHIVDAVLDDLERSKLIDDSLFASEWVRQRHERRGKSRRVLDRELQEKGVAAALREEALSQIDEADEEATARALATKKARSIKQAPADRAEYDKALRRVLGVLARRGFPESMSFSVAKEALDLRISELEG